MRWRYRLDRPACGEFRSLAGLDFANAWLSIHDGWMRVSEGYAWDGCSPSLRIPGAGLWVGTPDGPLGSDGRPVAWRASLFHDALCQFRGVIPGLTAEAATAVFAGLLAADGAPYWMQRIYPAAVLRFGPQDFMGDIERAWAVPKSE